MQNPAPVDRPVLDTIAQRWSPVIFSDRPVEPEKLERLFEAARWAASSSNDQPWSFVVATQEQPELFEKFAACLMPGNGWAKKAPVLVLSVARMVNAGTDNPNRYAFHDTGMAVGNLLTQATAEGLFVHQMGGFNVEKARVDLGLPAKHEPVAMLAIGYYGDAEQADAGSREREKKPRSRKPIAEFVFHGAWGK